MLTRLFIDNFKCFVNFEYRPAREQLILGDNGSGKTTLLDALLFLRQVAVKGAALDDFFILGRRTRWLSQPSQVIELEAILDGTSYTYRLVMEPSDDPTKARVRTEKVSIADRPLFSFDEGQVSLFNDQFEHTTDYPFDRNRSALALVATPGKDYRALARFRRWLSSLYCFKLNPFGMDPRADKQDSSPNVDLRNIVAWYRFLNQTDPRQTSALLESLRAAMPGFEYLMLEPAGENVMLLMAEFAQSCGTSTKFYLSELSDGQRCLIALYIVLHFVLAKGGTVIIDEPDNFISLREIQPWLLAATDTTEQSGGQLILISHHPELINQWAPNYGVQFVRDGLGPVRVKAFRGDPDSSLSPAELVARGWENG